MRPLMTRLELKATILLACKEPLALTTISKACGYQAMSGTVKQCIEELVQDRKLEVTQNPHPRHNQPRTLYRTVNL